MCQMIPFIFSANVISLIHFRIKTPVCYRINHIKYTCKFVKVNDLRAMT